MPFSTHCAATEFEFSGKKSMSIVMTGGTGDADLYVIRGSQPTKTSYDCRPFKNGNNEICSFTSPASGTYHISLLGYKEGCISC